MKRILIIICCFAVANLSFSQNKIDELIKISEVERIEKTLASDEMQGRRTFSVGIDKAAAFIAGEFQKTGLQVLNGSSGYLQQFVMVKPKFISATGIFDSSVIEQKNIIVFTTKPVIKINNQSNFEIVQVKATDTFRAGAFIQGKKNLLVLVHPAHERIFNNLARYKPETFPTERTLIFVMTDKLPGNFSLEATHEFTEMKLANVVGIIPGKSRPQEYVIFSGHYDHLGIAKPNAAMDSIFNGANDDASGTTAVIALAEYFKKMNNNERTLVFVAFTAEESGGFGSQYFSQQMDPAKVVAMFNIEMIGTHSKWGANSAFITGYEKTDMGKILEKNLQGSQFKFYPDPYPDQQLFYRSDNATLARLGVAAHTISTSKMDVEKFYHTQDDEIETLDMKNMTEIIKAIAISSTSIVTAKETPSRVDTSKLR
ncbi:MAG: M20/M25/M40 family metallo-hydrolase [Chitinophagaceae bacterium]|nr:M20/M25/M40 family metallo-hydrolase [Chitinophagaceae bacterium]